MPDFPFTLPKSLSTYAEQFDDNPGKATDKLQKHLQNRRLDPVGHLLLGWFFHKRGMRKEALEQAVKAKIFAPGSKYISLMHYYFSHPNFTEAWTPDALNYRSNKNKFFQEQISQGYNLDLNELIELLSDAESKKITIKDEQDASQTNTAKPVNNIDDIVTETLAQIHEKQGKLKVAKEAYKKLKKRHGKEKEEYYNKQIQRIEEKIETDSK